MDQLPNRRSKTRQVHVVLVAARFLPVVVSAFFLDLGNSPAKPARRVVNACAREQPHMQHVHGARHAVVGVAMGGISRRPVQCQRSRPRE